MLSMTGFGRGAAESGRRRIRVTLRGVNHRFLDIVVRGGDDLREVEPLIRDRLKTALARGRVEVQVASTPILGGDQGLGVDEELVASLAELGRRLAAEGGVRRAELDFAELLRVPGVLRTEADDLGWDDDDRAALTTAVDAALEQMVTARKLEGSSLERALEERIAGLETLLEPLQARQQGLTDELLQQLEGRVAEMLGDVAYDRERLLQEVALLVDKSDVSEELDRLASHLQHFRKVLGQTGSLGKRLDFLAQEIFRELNTIGSKCRNSEVTRRVVDGKVLCEQIREQVQNVE